MLQDKLGLSDDQVDTLRERFAEHRKQGREIVRDVLNDEQAERFDRHLERRRKARAEGPVGGRSDERTGGRGRRRRGRHGHRRDA